LTPAAPTRPAGPVAVILNPAAGLRRRRPARGLALAERVLARHGAIGTARLTEGPGHAADLARAAVAAGAVMVCAWGGDGTVNEVAGAVAGTSAALGIVPAGSGNGLARELGLPWDPARALAIALGRRERVIDAGEVDGRLFVNLAGIGLDAAVAARFNARGPARRGLLPYVAITARELFRYRCREYAIRVDGDTWQERALAVVCANARQYGGGAVVAPAARPDDGRLDLVVVAPRAPLTALCQGPHLFRGTLARVAGVRMAPFTTAEIAGTEPILFHVDGETAAGGTRLRVRVRPGVLRVRVP
jgi:diacylglycerol kinase (ATP)